jgi:hypothetical protein
MVNGPPNINPTPQQRPGNHQAPCPNEWGVFPETIQKQSEI